MSQSCEIDLTGTGNMRNKVIYATQRLLLSLIKEEYGVKPQRVKKGLSRGYDIHASEVGRFTLEGDTLVMQFYGMERQPRLPSFVA